MSPSLSCLGIIAAGFGLLILGNPIGHAAEPAPPSPQPSWGRIIVDTNSPGVFQLSIAKWPADGRLALPVPFPEIVAARFTHDSSPRPVPWEFTPDATQLTLLLPTNAPAGTDGAVTLETAPAGGQLADGRIVFTAQDARVQGSSAKLETNVNHHRIGFWTNPADAATWDFKPSRWGTYDAELTFSADGGAGTEIQVEIGDQKLGAIRPSTGGWYKYQTLPLGRIKLTRSDPFSVRVSCSRLVGGAVINLKALTLRPAPEGPGSTQSTDGEFVFRAANATTHSVRMRYEPQTNKNCLGYWVEAGDWADWQFHVDRPGVFDVEVLQGCGTGHGGSTVAVEIAGQALEFTVEETGHFQSFLPRKVGRVELNSRGDYSLAIRPRRKAGGAVMDVRQIRLTPVKPRDPGAAAPLFGARRVVFLGDSITYAGEWIEFAETLLRLRHPDVSVQWLNLGLPSETLSGLSEPGHAGGSFPRPDLHERLDRVLAQTKPDLIVACYGMNDGIYYPYGEERAEKFRAGHRRLREKAAAAGATVLHVTPPVFDPRPLKGNTLPAGRAEYRSPYEGYNDVLDRYSEWLISQRANGWDVVDFHGPLNRYLAQRRTQDPNFLLAGDGVHATTLGHWRMAREFVRHWEKITDDTIPETPELFEAQSVRAREVLAAVRSRQRLLKDPWLHGVGHLRPGMGAGAPWADANRLAPAHAAAAQAAADPSFTGRHSRWYGFERVEFPLNGRTVSVVIPHRVATGRPWVWHGEFFGHKPEPDIALLGRGFHVVYLSMSNELGSPHAVRAWDELYDLLTRRWELNPKPALVGLSRGGLYCYNWATAHPDRVSCIYGDAPVCDFKSWPGAFGAGKRSDDDWKLVLSRYGFASDDEARAYTGNPVDRLAGLAAAHVPLLHVYGDADEVVPWQENTGVIASRYRALGGHITLIGKPGVMHHPHGLTNPTPIVDFIWHHAAPAAAQAELARRGGGPLAVDGRPLIRKRGTVDVDLVETSPVVFGGRLWRFEWVRHGAGQPYWDNQRQTNYFRFRDPNNGDVTPPFADGFEFGSAFVADGTMYVTGTYHREAVHVFASHDLKTWETWVALPAGRYGIYNTSVCRAGDEYVLMFEIDRPEAEAGRAFTARFAKSRDLRTWTLTPPECNYAKDRYTAPHALRWHGGWFYDFYLEARDGYEMRVVRSRDLITWIASPWNPVLRSSAEDQLIAQSKLTDPQRTRIANAVNRNNSDLDFCEWNGRLVMQYSWGNQLGIEHLAEASYEGSEAQFLEGWFTE